MMKYLIEIMEKGGEGIMIRKSNSKYEKGRSSLLQKVKPQFLSIGTVTKAQSFKNTIQIKSFNKLEFRLYSKVSELKYGDIIKERKIEFKFNSISMEYQECQLLINYYQIIKRKNLIQMKNKILIFLLKLKVFIFYNNLIFEERLEKLKELKLQIKDKRINVNFYFYFKIF